MILQELLGDLPVRRFIADHYLKLPYSAAAGAGRLVPLGSWSTLERLLAGRDVDVLVARDGRRPPATGGSSPNQPSYAEARDLFASGHTLVVRHAERHDPELERLAAAFRADLEAPVNVHLYYTPAGGFGFDWHYDVEEVFTILTEGTKEFSLRRNTVNPWPLLETFPDDLKFEREISPIVECKLEPGDWLYIPAGYWHRARAREQDAITVAVGLGEPVALEIHDFLRDELLQAVLWRRRLPPSGEAVGQDRETREAEHAALFAELGDDLARLMRDRRVVRAFTEARAAGFKPRRSMRPRGSAPR